MTQPVDAKPTRPFGLTLAIVAVVVIYAVLPLVAVAFVIYLENVMVSGIQGGFVGIDMNISLMALAIPAIVAAVLLLESILTWRGLRWMRYIFPFSVLLYTLVLVAGYVLPLLSTPGTPALSGVDSTTQYQAPLVSAYMLVGVLMTVYVVWFTQRWSSVAFFRGYYTPEDHERLSAMVAA